MRLAISFLAPLALLGQVTLTPPESGYAPPGAAQTKSLADSTARAPKDLLTHFEKSNYLETGRYAESLQIAHKLEKASPLVRLVTLGKTPQGRDLVMLVVSSDRAFTPQAAARTGKTILLLQNGIHAGEIAGKDATAMLLRDVLVTKKYASWLDKVIILAIPVFNVDGHERISVYNRINQNGPREMGFRVTSQRYNLNRDYMKADSPEMRAWLKMYTAWLPDMMMDNHVTDGADYQYDVNISMATEQDIWPTIGNWARDRFMPALMDAMRKDEHSIGPNGEYVEGQGYFTGVLQPRFSHSYAGVQNRAGMLVETHSLKPYRTQVWAHYDIMRHTLDLLAGGGSVLKDAVREADQGIARMGASYNSGTKLFLAGKNSSQSNPFNYLGVAAQREKSELLGAEYPHYGKQPVEIPTRIFDRVETTESAAVPLAYAIPPEWTTLLALLEVHGVKTEKITAPQKAEVEVYRLRGAKWGDQPFEGHLLVEFNVEVARESRTLPAGWVRVPMTQRAARVAMNVLEPNAPDSAVRWGLIDTIFEQKEYASDYVMEGIARQMLSQNPELKREFEDRLRSDAAFAGNPGARLMFLYQHSPYYEQDKDLYPVLRVIKDQ